MTTDTISSLHRLTDAQQEAVLPDRNVWLSASAGSGKTQVLSARVIRLLLEDGVRPENLLCLTFTKAAAAEMAERINRRLASWVQAKGDVLKAELEAIGSSYGPEARAKARKLFAQVLDAPGGGLQIMTIHSFCQSLLASFPEEAGLLPGFEPIDDRAVAELHSDALAELVQFAQKDGRDWLIANLQDLSLALGEDGVRGFLRRCATHGDTLEQFVPDDKGALMLARRIMEIDFEGTIAEELGRRCDDAAINTTLLSTLAQLNYDWSKGVAGKRGTDRALAIRTWLANDVADRAANLNEIQRCFMKGDGEPFVSSKGYTPLDPEYARLATDAFEWVASLVQFRNAAAYAERLAPALITGKAYAAQYRTMKHARGLVDFDDLIANAARLLNQGGMAEWVRYKLDRKIDHILVDEAQDTNDAQWDIIEALSDDFFSGAGAGKERARTVFAVGDFKQAIYGFQGTAPEKYRDAGDRLQTKIADAGEELHRLTLSQSFRSTRPILDFVNAVADGIGHEALGLDEPVPDHFSEKPNHGTIELMRCVKPKSEDDDGEKDESEEQWLSEEKRKLAHRVAQHVKNLIDAKPVLATTGLPLKPGDIMILLRARGELAGLIVARLHALGVPVAGIDRLRIIEPIAVQDLLAAIRFVLQPKDDLSLACLLVSPLLGWDQDRLLKHGYRDKHVDLWQHLRSQPEIEAELEPLRAMLRAADQTTPYAFLENILSGPTGGRRKFQARLGAETLVPIEELLNLAIQYQQEGGASLQGFLDWFDRGEGEIKREGLAQSSDVRVMTVHGAKGLEAPVVILADIASDPEQSGKRNNVVNIPMGNDRHLPLLPIKKHERSGLVAKVVDDKEKADMQEHYRLLYVAMTRASEHLVMAGSLGKWAKDGPPEKSWYAALEAGMAALGCDWQSDALWGATMRYDAVGAFDRKKQDSAEPAEPAVAPAWLFQPAPEEENPPRPLAPSNLEDDLYGDAPASDTLRLAALRGKLMHSLFEQYDGRDLAQFRVDALSWLGRNDREAKLDHQAMTDQITAVLQNADWKPLFSKAARAEVPLAALVGSTVISGRVDRLLIEPDRVRLVDFKTGRKVPGSEADIAIPQLRQMAHYVAALEAIFLGRRIEASLLYTAGPAMLTLSADALAPHKPA